MSNSALAAGLRQLRGKLAAQQHNGDSDEQLLHAFLTCRDEDAFTVLVRRHGPMVLRVCWRVLGHEQDAEDAFQATFLVLSRQAARLRKKTALTSWLYGIAYRIALKAKQAAARRRKHEGQAFSQAPADPIEEISWREMQALVDEEIVRLPEIYRSVFVLCCVENIGREEAARRLGINEGTLSSRLAKARKRLSQRLARRGVGLTAVLAASALATAETPAMLPLLVASTLRAVQSEGAAGLVSANVAALVRSATASAMLSKTKMAMAMLLLVATSGALVGVYRTAGGPLAATVQLSHEERKDEQPKPSRKDNAAIALHGRVLGPDSKPIASARLFLSLDGSREKARAVVRAISDKEGRFRFAAKPADFNEIGKATLAAAADGFGPDWIEVTSKNKDALTLRLVKDDVPLKGRILNLEGKPVANVTVRVQELLHGLDYSTKSLAAASLDAPMQAVTGPDGRFELRGLGRERFVHLMIEGDNIERIHCWALTREGKILNPPKGLSKYNESIYAATFDHIAAPTKPIIGTVRDKATGKPLAGITVVMKRWINSAVTNERGRYRIVGNAKQREYSISAVGKPYFVLEKDHIADTSGLEPLVVNFELDRGIEIAGRAFNKDTGEPIQVEITYHALKDNPHLKRVSSLERFQSNFVDDRCHGKPGGSFWVIALPGPGYLAVVAARDYYHKERPADVMKVVPFTIAPPLFHAWVRIDPSENGPKSIRCDIALEPVKPIPGQVFDAEGKPLSGYFVAGLTGSPLITSDQRSLHEKPTFQVHGFDPSSPRKLFFLHPKKKLGTIVVVRKYQSDPLQVRLKLLGAVAGRVLDAAGRPCPGLYVRAEINNKDDSLVRTLLLFEWGLRENHFDPLAKTDAEGKFRLDGLLPGLKYTLLVGESEKRFQTRIVARCENVIVECGKDKDLGDLKSK